MADLGTHTPFFSSQFPTPFACFLNSHFPALSKNLVAKNLVAKFQRQIPPEAISERFRWQCDHVVSNRYSTIARTINAVPAAVSDPSTLSMMHHRRSTCASCKKQQSAA